MGFSGFSSNFIISLDTFSTLMNSVNQSVSVLYVCVTHILFSSFAFLPSFPALCVSHFGAETGNIVEALLGVPLLPALLASKAEFLVLVLSLGIRAAKITVNILVFRVKKKISTCQLDIYDCSVQS